MAEVVPPKSYLLITSSAALEVNESTFNIDIPLY